MGIRGFPEPAAVLHPAARPVGLIGGVGSDLGPEFLVETPLGVLEPGGPRTRYRPGLSGALVVQAPLRLAQSLAPSLRVGQLRRQLVAGCFAERGILGRVDGPSLVENPPRDLLVVEGRVAAGR
jgi:hypothetical protein